jgi:hypothetical protein
MTILIGFCGDSLQPLHLSPERIAAYKSLGIGDICRIVVWPELMWLNRTDPIDWSRTDRHFQVLEDAGVQIYPNFFGAPKWMSGGKPAYQEGINGCWQYNDPSGQHNHALGFHQVGSCNPRCPNCALEPERVAYCFTNIPHINADALSEFARQFALRYRGRFKYIGAGNEPTTGPGLFWPPSGTGDFDTALPRLANEYMLPVVDAVRSVDPLVQHVGHEADSGDGLRRILAIRQPDILSVHPYVGVFDVDEAMGWVRVHGNGQPVWNTEMDPDPDWYADVLERLPQIAAHFVYDPDRLLNADLTPNAAGRRFKSVLDAHRPLADWLQHRYVSSELTPGTALAMLGKPTGAAEAAAFRQLVERIDSAFIPRRRSARHS